MPHITFPELRYRGLEIGTSGQGEIVINHHDLETDENGVGHLVFSLPQARNLVHQTLKRVVGDRTAEMPQGTVLQSLERVGRMSEGDPTWNLGEDDRNALRVLLSQLERLHDERCWRLIESAPKTGEPVLGFMPTYYRNKGGVSVIIWMEGKWFDNLAFEAKPSHWMPLPPSPRGFPI